MRAKLLQLCPTLCDPVDYSRPQSSVHGILQERILEWVAVPSTREFPDPEIERVSLMSLALADGFFTTRSIFYPHHLIVLDYRTPSNIHLTFSKNQTLV